MRILLTLLFILCTMATQGQVAEALLKVTLTSDLSDKLDRIYWSESNSYATYCRQYWMGVLPSEKSEILTTKKLPYSCAEASNSNLKILRNTTEFIVSIWWYPRMASHVNSAIYLGLSPNATAKGQDILLPQMQLVDIRQELDSIDYAVLINEITKGFKIRVGLDKGAKMEEQTIRKIPMNEIPQLRQCPRDGLIKMILDKTNIGLLQPCFDSELKIWITMTEFESSVGSQNPVALYISDHWDLKETDTGSENLTPWGNDTAHTLLTRTTVSLGIEFENGAMVWYDWNNLEDELNLGEEWQCDVLYKSYLESTFYKKVKLQLIDRY